MSEVRGEPVQISTETDEHLRLAVRAANVGVWDWDLQTSELYCSSEFKRQLGFEPHESVWGDLGWQDSVHPDDIAGLLEARGAYLAAPVAECSAEFRLRHKDGTYRWILAQGALLSDENGKPTRLIGASVDITRRKEFEQALRASEGRLNAIINTTPDVAMQGYDLDGRVVLWNKASELIFGWSAEEAIGKTLDQLIHTKSEAEDLLQLLRSMVGQGQAIGPLEYCFRRRNGEEAWCLSTLFEIPGIDGQPIFICMDVDLTERRRVTEALRANEASFRGFVDALPEPAMMIRVDGTVIMVNHAMARSLGTTVNELVGKCVFDKLPPEVEATRKYWIEKTKLSRQSCSFEDTNGERRFLNYFNPVIEANGEVTRIAVIALNITELERAQQALHRSEALFRAIVEDQNEMIVRWKPDGTRTFVNPAYCRTYAKTYDELVGSKIDSFFKLPHTEKVYERIHKITPENPTTTGVLESIGPNGESLWQEWTARGLFDSDGNLVEVQSIGRDITERIRAERRTRQINRMYAVTSDVNQLMLRESDLKQLLSTTCQIVVEKGGFKLAWIGFKSSKSSAIDLFAHAGTTDDKVCVLENMLMNRESACPLTISALDTGRRLFSNDVANDSRLTWCNEVLQQNGYRSLASLPIKVGEETVGVLNLYAGEVGFFDDQELRLLDELAQDIGSALEVNRRESERRRAEAALRESEERFRQLAETIQEIFWLVDPAENKIIYVSPAYEKIWGRSRNHLYSQRFAWLDGIHSEDQARVMRAASADPSMAGYDQEYRIIRPDGSIRWIRDMAFPVYNEAGQVERIAGVARDVTLHHEAVEALRESQRQLERAQQVGRIGSWVVDRDGNLNFSAETYRIFDLTPAEFDGRIETFLNFVHPEDRAAVKAAGEAAISTPQRYAIEHRIVRRDGRVCWLYEQADVEVDSKGQGLRLIGVVQDITERKLLEDQLRQAQKMEAIGQLAGAVAHDFNNILAAVLMQAEVASMTENLPGDVQESLVEIRNCADRAAKLTRQLLVFSRRQVMQRKLLDVNDSVTNLARMLQRVLGADVRLQLHLHPEALAIRADAGMLDQVLLNLAVNARDAMPVGGYLTIETSRFQVGPQEALAMGKIASGPYACISVADTGEGISQEVMPHIFEPFFTTKQPGKGTGLGLATVFGIVKQHQGAIDVKTETGKGTTFRIFFPLDIQTTSTPLDQPGALQSPGGTETIMLVEDEPSVRTVTRAVLIRAGYRVIEASNGSEALSLWATLAEKPALLLTDMVMPGGMHGSQLGKQLGQQAPGLKIIYMSGYSQEYNGGTMDLLPGENFLQKPFKKQDLLTTIRRALDR
jgi:PAS domain S-box-containing protein